MPRKSFCLWIVSSEDGKVKKLRFSFRALLGTTLIVSLIAGGILAILGDYGRAQFLRAKHFLSLQVVSKERDELQGITSTLQDQLQDVKAENSQHMSYKEDIKGKIKQLEEVLESAIALSGAERREAKNLAKPYSSSGGVGGAESPCTRGRGSKRRCEALFFSNNLLSDDDGIAKVNAIGDELVRRLDTYITLLRSFPLGHPVFGEETSGFGVRRSPFTGKFAVHKGIDFSLKDTDKIRVTGEGTVKSIKSNSTYGLMIDVQHKHRVVTRYAHLSRVLVKVGDKVSRGDIIALGGSTGRSTGPHLHYEVRIGGKARNPARFLNLAQKLERVIRG